MRKHFLVLSSVFIAAGCNSNSIAYYVSGRSNDEHIFKDGETVKDRFILPDGYERLPVNGFGQYLRELALKPHGTDVYHYDGSVKHNNVHAAVIKMDIGNKNLQQCADAVIRLRAEYLYKTGQYDKIHFKFTNGFNADYNKWAEGYRIQVRGNDVQWVKLTASDNDYKTFREYLDVIFSYAGTLSLSKELKTVDINEVQPGDVFIKGGSPGHAVAVIDVAENNKGQKIFMIAQSYMPAQDIEVLVNSNDKMLTPWYSIDTNNVDVITPEYDFTIYDLKRFDDK